LAAIVGFRATMKNMDKNITTFNKDSFNYSLSRPSYPKEIYDFLSQQVINNDTAWDCACGTGQIASSLIDYFSIVFASDINSNQIDNRLENERIKYTIQNSEKTSYQDNFFDLVCVGQALHWFDFNRFFKEVNRVLRPNGVFACWGYSFFKISPEIDKAIEINFLQPIYPYWSEKNYILWEKYISIDFPFMEIVSPEFEMIQDWTKEELFEYLITWSAYKRCVEETHKDLKTGYFKGLSKVWPDNYKMKINMDFVFYSGRKKE
jgi:ubiquinone/menaquinone biosynthesis C-methylase UbiE